jgi:hypothetical protein
MKIIVKGKPLRYKGKLYRTGDAANVSRQHARVLTALKRGTIAPQPEPKPAAVKTPAAPATPPAAPKAAPPHHVAPHSNPHHLEPIDHDHSIPTLTQPATQAAPTPLRARIAKAKQPK